MAYEGGPNLDPCGCSSDAVKDAAWADSRMTGLVTGHQQTFSRNGGDLLVYFTDVGDYRWGFTHDDSVLSTPKLTAVNQINKWFSAPTR